MEIDPKFGTVEYWNAAGFWGPNGLALAEFGAAVAQIELSEGIQWDDVEAIGTMQYLRRKPVD